VTEREVNDHLDQCLKRSNAEDSIAPGVHEDDKQCPAQEDSRITNLMKPLTEITEDVDAPPFRLHLGEAEEIGKKLMSASRFSRNSRVRPNSTSMKTAQEPASSPNPAALSSPASDAHSPEIQIQDTNQHPSSVVIRPPPPSMLVTEGETSDCNPNPDPDPTPFYEVEARLVEEQEDPTLYDAELVTLSERQEHVRSFWERHRTAIAIVVILALAIVALFFATWNRDDKVTTTTSTPLVTTSYSTTTLTSTLPPIDDRKQTAISTASFTIAPASSTDNATKQVEVTATTTESLVSSTSIATTTTTATQATPPLIDQIVLPSSSVETMAEERCELFNLTMVESTLFKGHCEDGCVHTVVIEKDTAMVAVDNTTIRFLSNVNEQNFEEVSMFRVNYAIDSGAISDDVAVVGYTHDLYNNKTGGVYIFQKDNLKHWAQRVHISPSDLNIAPVADKYFRIVVAIDGAVLVVGVPGNKQAYVYRNEDAAWVQEAILSPLDLNVERFGEAVSIKESTIVVGDFLYGRHEEGAVFVYEHKSPSHWIKQDVVLNDECDGWFGASLSLMHDKGLLVGCPAMNNRTGAVYYYKIDESQGRYVLRQKINVSKSEPKDYLGAQNSIAVDGNSMILGTHYKKQGGKIYVFKRSHQHHIWKEVAMLDRPPFTSNFGTYVALSEDRALIGSDGNAWTCLITGDVTFRSAFFSNDCVDCHPRVAMNGDTSVVVNGDEIHFMSKNKGRFEKVKTIEMHAPHSVSVSGNLTAVSGTYNNDTVSMFFNVYEKDSSSVWVQIAHFLRDGRWNNGFSDNFVAVDGNLLVFVDTYTNAKGSASYATLYHRRNQTFWVIEDEDPLWPKAPGLASEFNRQSVSMKNNTIAFGDYINGRVNVYEYNPIINSLTPLSSLKKDDCKSWYGSSVTMTDRRELLVGCFGDNDAAGAVYYYTMSRNRDYVLKQIIDSVDGTIGDWFGNHVAVDGNFMVVGKRKDFGGKAYVFKRANQNEWIELAVIDAPTPRSKHFGRFVAISGREILIESDRNVYYYTLEQC